MLGLTLARNIRRLIVADVVIETQRIKARSFEHREVPICEANVWYEDRERTVRAERNWWGNRQHRQILRSCLHQSWASALDSHPGRRARQISYLRNLTGQTPDLPSAARTLGFGKKCNLVRESDCRVPKGRPT